MLDRTDSWEEEPDLEEALSLLAAAISEGRITDREQLQREKIRVLRGLPLSRVPGNGLILDYIDKTRPDLIEQALPLLRRKPGRTLSGVAVVAAMTSPHECPHGRCVFCPGGADCEVPTPQSYTGREPAAMRGAQNDFDPYLQVKNRLDQLRYIGHDVDKVDLILMGGTVTARTHGYQERFVKGCLDAMNGAPSGDIEEAQSLNEKAPVRCIGITFETRPDRCGEEEIELMLRLGGTRVELGVQSTFDAPLIVSGRGHDVRSSVDATRRLKDSGMKVSYHLMPGMPGSNLEMDLESARRVFEDPMFRPDKIKIYPTLVLKGTELYDCWKRGEYEPLATEEAAELVARIKEMTPPWVRISRVQRDIPSPLVDAGVKKSNLRQLAGDIMLKQGKKCRCIRCREVGHRSLDIGSIPQNEIEPVKREYEASGGVEVFLSYEHPDTDTLIGYLRLRKPSKEASGIVSEGTALVREVKVFGEMVPIGEGPGENWQHRGLGTGLMEKAEEHAKEKWGSHTMLVNSGIGVREYYRGMGYERCGPYMGKHL